MDDAEYLARIDLLPITTAADLDNVESQWRTIRQRRAFMTPNNDPDAYRATLRALGPNVLPYVVVLRDTAGPCAALIGRLDQRGTGSTTRRLRAPQLVGHCLDVVYGGLLANDDVSRAALLAQLERIITHHRLDLVRINHLPLSDALFTMITEHPRLGRLVNVTVVEPHWRFTLAPGSFAETMGRFKKKRRDELKREARRLAERFSGSLETVVLGRPDEVDRILKDGQAISSCTYHARIGNPFSDVPMWREHLSLESSKGNLRALFLIAAGRAIAFNVGSVHGDTLVLYALAHLPEYGCFSPGKYLLLRVFEQCCLENLSFVDYGFGDAEYKRTFATEHWDEANLHIYAPRWRPQLAKRIESVGVAAGRCGKRLAVELGVMKRIKKLWKSGSARQ